MKIDTALVMSRQPSREKSVRDAVARAIKALKADGANAALVAFEYAQRLAPSDLAITVTIGDLRLALDDPAAAEPFEWVARKADWRDAWIRLAIVRQRFATPALAAAEMHRVLSGHAPPRKSEFHRLATDIADASGALGWCGLDSSGCLTLGGAVRQMPEDAITVLVDDVRLRLRPLAVPTDSLVRQFRLMGPWKHGGRLTVLAKGNPLIGSPVAIQKLTRVEGFVRTDAGGVRGWCWLPGDPDAIPQIIVANVSNPRKRIMVRARQLQTDDGQFADFAAPRHFQLSAQDIAALNGPVAVSGPHGKPLYGSPLNPMGEIDSGAAAARTIARKFPAVSAPDHAALNDPCEISIPARLLGPKPRHPEPPADRPVLVVIPVYRGLEVTLACIDSVLAAKSINEEILVVVDDSPDHELIACLQKMAVDGVIGLDLRPVNRGFPATANIGLRWGAARGCDVILLNSDTLVPPDWIVTLRQAVYAHNDDIGTATPLSNAATIFSYPHVDAVNRIPDFEDTVRLARLAREVNGSHTVEVPTGHGFCLYIRLECLLDTGVLREDVFGHGYGEENDFCLRARHLGWRHVAATGTFVGHIEGQSFAAAKTHLTARNLGILNRLHPGYDQVIAEWQQDAPLMEMRRNLDIARWHIEQAERSAVLLVVHDRQGGVLKYVNERAERLVRDGRHAIIVRPRKDRAGRSCITLMTPGGDTYPNLFFQVPAEASDFRRFLLGCRAERIELHHFIGHDPGTIPAITALGLPYDIHVHDYAWFCPRVTLTGRENRYCGEPDMPVCQACIADHGSNIDEPIGPAELMLRSKRLFDGARAVISPSHDTADRIRRRFGVDVGLGIWQDETAELFLKPVVKKPNEVRRICLAGAIGYEKGYEILLECARIVAARRLPLEFVLVGFSCDDARLLETGCVRIIGRYEEDEAVRLIERQGADFAFLPALWPETWSYVLTQFWEAGLPVVAFDIGAPAERIRRRSGGLLLPLNLSAERLVRIFMDPELFRCDEAHADPDLSNPQGVSSNAADAEDKPAAANLDPVSCHQHPLPVAVEADDTETAEAGETMSRQQTPLIMVDS